MTTVYVMHVYAVSGVIQYTDDDTGETELVSSIMSVWSSAELAHRHGEKWVASHPDKAHLVYDVTPSRVDEFKEALDA